MSDALLHWDHCIHAEGWWTLTLVAITSCLRCSGPRAAIHSPITASDSLYTLAVSAEQASSIDARSERKVIGSREAAACRCLLTNEVSTCCYECIQHLEASILICSRQSPRSTIAAFEAECHASQADHAHFQTGAAQGAVLLFQQNNRQEPGSSDKQYQRTG
jgi:hypothetical protein